jgi:ABC-2 type transport system permease protein
MMPSIVSRIARHEWRSLVADRTLWTLVPLLLGLVGYGLFNGISWVRGQERTLAAARHDQDETTTRSQETIRAIEAEGREVPPWLDPRMPSVAGKNGLATMPPAPLAALTIGQSDLYPFYFKVSTASRQTFLQNDEIENPLNLLAGRFDLAFVIVFLLPLAILAVSYNLLAAEKEQGLLPLLLAQPIRLAQLVSGKVLVRAAIVIGVPAAVMLIGALAAAHGDPNAVLWRLALWLVIIVAYEAFWFALAVLVNLLGRSSAANALVLAGAWLALVLVVPSLVAIGVTALYPMPSRVELIQAVRDASNDTQRRGTALLTKYYGDHPELMPQSGLDLNDYAIRGFLIQRLIEKSIDPVMTRFDVQLARQQRLVDRLRFLSPAIVVQQALNDVAGTSTARQLHFVTQVKTFHEEWRAWFEPRVFRRIVLTAADHDAVPRFSFQEEPSHAILGRVAWGLAGLLIPLAVVIVAATRALGRFSVVA